MREHRQNRFATRPARVGVAVAALVTTAAGAATIVPGQAIVEVKSAFSIKDINGDYETVEIGAISPHKIYLLDLPEGSIEEEFVELLASDSRIKAAEVNLVERHVDIRLHVRFRPTVATRERGAKRLVTPHDFAQRPSQRVDVEPSSQSFRIMGRPPPKDRCPCHVDSNTLGDSVGSATIRSVENTDSTLCVPRLHVVCPFILDPSL